ncbi:MAG: hypothetical protein ACYTGD_19245 [Planctomycetota bacterium]
MKTYSIKEGYEHRTANVTLETEPGDYFTPTRIKNGRYLQAHPYLEAARLMRREGLRSVLDVGCGTGCKLVAHLEPVAETSVGIDQQTVIDLVHKLHPEARRSSTCSTRTCCSTSSGPTATTGAGWPSPPRSGTCGGGRTT